MFVYWHKTQYLCTVCSYSKLMLTLMQNLNTYLGLDINFNHCGFFLLTALVGNIIHYLIL